MKKNLLLTSLIFLSTCAVCLAQDVNPYQQPPNTAESYNLPTLEKMLNKSTEPNLPTTTPEQMDTLKSALDLQKLKAEQNQIRATGASELTILNKTSDPIYATIDLKKLILPAGCYLTNNIVSYRTPTIARRSTWTWHDAKMSSPPCAVCCTPGTQATISSDNWIPPNNIVTFDFLDLSNTDDYNNFDNPPTVQKLDGSFWKIKISASFDSTTRTYTLTVEEVKQ